MFLTLRAQRPPCRSLAFTEAGLVLGAGTLVAPMRGGGDAAEDPGPVNLADSLRGVSTRHFKRDGGRLAAAGNAC